MGLTAGNGRDAGDGDVDLRRDGDPLKELLLLRVAPKTGGFIGVENDVGVPGVEGTGEGASAEESGGKLLPLRPPKSGGAGLFDEIRLLLGGRSMRDIVPCCDSENCPSFVFRV